LPPRLALPLGSYGIAQRRAAVNDVTLLFDDLGRDLVHAGRSLAKARAFTFVCVVSLGIGMVPVIAVPYIARIPNTPPRGVNTDRLVELVTTARGTRPAADSWSYPDFLDLRDADTGIVLIGWAPRLVKTTIPTPEGVRTDPVRMLYVSRNYFATIGVTLARGPGFGAATGPVVILGHELWQNLLGGDPGIVGKTLTLDGIPHVVVGIAPDGFQGHLGFMGKRLFVPLEQHPLLTADDKARSDRANEWLHIHGRLSPGVGMAQASAAVATVTALLAKQHPATNELKAGTVAPYHPGGSLGRSELRRLEAVALTFTGMVLLVVCLNVSGMMLVRNALRERELSIRDAIGAGRGQLIRYLLTEAILLAGFGGALGSIVLFNLPSVISWLKGQPFPPAEFQDVFKVDLHMIAICVGLCLVTTLMFGLLPAFRFSRPVILSALKDDAGGGGARVGRIHRLAAALQMTIAVPLVVMGGRSLERARATATADLGFESDLLYAAPLKFEGVANESAAFRIRSVRDTLEKANGVASVTLADGLPLDFDGRGTRVCLPAEPNVAPRFFSVQVTRVDEAYLKTMGIPLLRGRGFAADDAAGGELVTVISKTLAGELFPNTDAVSAIGKRLKLGADEKTQQTLTIVGVTGDFPTSQMSTERAQLLLPLAEHPSLNVYLVARSVAGEHPSKLTAALENAVRDLGPDFGARTRSIGVATPGGPRNDPRAYSVVTGVWLRQNSVRDFLVASSVVGGAGGVILMLAALGIYGVVGLMVATRTREIAVRVALGATRRRVMSMVLLDVVKLVMPGAAVGLVLTAVLVRLNGVEKMGIALSSLEPLAYVVGAAMAVLVAVVASLAPAHRAASVQPMTAMRSL
jgi:predicted permease